MKGDRKICNFPNENFPILHAQQTAAEQTPNLPPKPTNAEISFRVVLHDLGKAQR